MSPLKRPSSVEGLRAAATAPRHTVPLPAAGTQTPVVVSKPVRLNADIDRELHRWLKGFALQADTDMAHIVRALLAELQADDALADRVRAGLSS